MKTKQISTASAGRVGGAGCAIEVKTVPTPKLSDLPPVLCSSSTAPPIIDRNVSKNFVIMNNAKKQSTQKEITKIKKVQIIEPSFGKPRIILAQKNEQTIKYKCGFCPELFEKMIDLSKHQAQFHKVSSQNDTNQEFEELPQNNQCEFCKKWFSKPMDLEVHKLHYCEKVIEQPSIQKSAQKKLTKNIEPYFCNPEKITKIKLHYSEKVLPTDKNSSEKKITKIIEPSTSSRAVRKGGPMAPPDPGRFRSITCSIKKPSVTACPSRSDLLSRPKSLYISSAVGYVSLVEQDPIENVF